MPVLLNIPKVHFDFGAIGALADELTNLGISRALFITDRGLVECGVFDKVLTTLHRNRDFPIFDETPENPTVGGVAKAYELYRHEDCDCVVAVGGGSVIDTSKAVALRAGHPGPISQYDRHSEKITAATAPIVAVPTTAGTGSEVTSGAGIHPDSSSPAINIGSPHLLPKVAICDPDLTLSLPPVLTAGTGMDALSQCFEGYLSTGVNPPVDAIALDGIRRAVTYIERAVADGSNKEARWHMMMAALEGGICIGKGLGSGHAIANTLGDRGHHHGTLVTVVLPSVLRFLEGHVGDKMTRLAEALGVHEGDEVAAAIERLNVRVGMPTTLRELGYPLDDLDKVAEVCVGSVFNLTSPRIPTHGEYKAIITDAMG